MALDLPPQLIARFQKLRTLEQMQRLEPAEFEQFTAWLYTQEGYDSAVMGMTGDQGVDVMLQKDGRKIIVQCKRYEGNVGQPTVRDLYGAMFHFQAQEAHLVTSGTISRQAEEWAVGKPIKLVDGNDLVAWVNELRRGGQLNVGSTSSWLPNLPTFGSDKQWVGLVAAGGILSFLVVCAALLFLYNSMSSRLSNPTPTVPVAIVTPRPTNPPLLTSTATRTIGATPTPRPNATATIAGTPTLVAQDISQINVPQVSNPPRIDGDLTEWPLTGGILTSHVVEQDGWDGSQDVTAVWRFAWDDRNLYIAVNVVDNIHVQEQEAKYAYYGDSLELQFDTNLADFEKRVSLDDYQYVFSPGNFGSLSASGFRFRGRSDQNNHFDEFAGSRAQVATQRTSNGYIIEASIPWNEMEVAAAAGLKMGAAFSTNDIDTPGQRRQEVMVSNVPGRLWADPTTWGTITLTR